jgi:hypothetical protein
MRGEAITAREPTIRRRLRCLRGALPAADWVLGSIDIELGTHVPDCDVIPYDLSPPIDTPSPDISDMLRSQIGRARARRSSR